MHREFKIFYRSLCTYSISQILCQSGYEVLILKDYLPVNSPDRVVITEAQKQNAILVSINGDFADIVNYPPTNYQGIISIQLTRSPRNYSAVNAAAFELFIQT